MNSNRSEGNCHQQHINHLPAHATPLPNTPKADIYPISAYAIHFVFAFQHSSNQWLITFMLNRHQSEADKFEYKPSPIFK